MEANRFPLICAALLPPSLHGRVLISHFKSKRPAGADTFIVHFKASIDNLLASNGNPNNEKSPRSWNDYVNWKMKKKKKFEEYREIGLRLKGYPEEDVRQARKLVSSFIRAAEEVEEMEILKREATPSMRLLNDLLNMHDGFDDDGWLKECKKCTINTFPREDPFSILVPAGFDIDKLLFCKHTESNQDGEFSPSIKGPLQLPPETDVLLSIDFAREVDALLLEVRNEQSEVQNIEGFDPESVATKLKQQEKQRTIREVEALLDLAIYLKW